MGGQEKPDWEVKIWGGQGGKLQGQLGLEHSSRKGTGDAGLFQGQPGGQCGCGQVTKGRVVQEKVMEVTG